MRVLIACSTHRCLIFVADGHGMDQIRRTFTEDVMILRHDAADHCNAEIRNVDQFIMINRDLIFYIFQHETL